MRVQHPGRRALLAAIAGGIGLATLLLADPALAQAGEVSKVLDGATKALEGMLTASGGRIGEWARMILLTLLVVDFVVRGGKWVMSGQSFSDFAEQMVYSIGIVSLALGFITLAPGVVSAIAAEATQLGTGGPPDPNAEAAVKPSKIMSGGLARAQGWLGQINLLDPASLAFLLCAGLSLVVMAAEMAMVILVYAELYLVGLVGIATLCFAGLAQTRNIASRYFMALVGKGFKLLTLLLVVAATHDVAQRIVEATSTPGSTPVQGPMRLAPGVTGADPVTLEGALGAVFMQIVGLVLVIMLPGAVERLVGGSSVGDIAGQGAKMAAGAAASGLAAAGGAAVGAAGGAVAGGAAAAKTAGAGAFTGGVNWKSLAEGGKAAAKGAVSGAARGGVNLGQMASERGGISKELGARLRDAVNRPAAAPKGDSGAS